MAHHCIDVEKAKEPEKCDTVPGTEPPWSRICRHLPFFAKGKTIRDLVYVVT